MDLDFKRIITAFLLCMLIMVGWQYMTNRLNPPAEQPPAAPQPKQPAVTVAQPDRAAPDQSAGWQSAAPATWRVLTYEDAPADIEFGSRDYTLGGYKALITIDGSTASVRSVMLSEHKHAVTDEYTGYPLLSVATDQAGRQLQSLMLGTVKLKIAEVPMSFDLSRDCWRLADEARQVSVSDGTESVSYTATIADEQDQPVCRIVKRYSYRPEDYDLSFQLQVLNDSSVPIEIASMELLGPAGPPREDPRSDQRSVVAAYKSMDQKIEVERQMMPKLEKNLKDGLTAEKSIIHQPAGSNLLWFAVANKFFAAVVHPIVPEGDRQVDYIVRGEVRARVVTASTDIEDDPDAASATGQVTIATDRQVAPNEQAAFNFDVYLGPIDKEIFDQAKYASRDYKELLYKGGCAFCAFDWLTFALLKIMKAIYTVVHNYGVAIIILVLVVRLLLHPITKKSQVNMMSMSKLGPEIEEIRKKYANDKQELNRRTMEIYKKQGITPILGCLPMLLQMPIWIGLYTAVNMNVALRHKGLLPASWHWINDLSAPDRLIPFEWLGISPVAVPLVGTVDALNLLPILLCVAMFLQQKLMPHASASSNPQAAQQQKMMLIMMPVMMLVFLYTAPSGLNMYIMASTFCGVFEQHFIRKHIRAQQEIEKAGTVATTTKVGGRMGPKQRKPKPPRKFI